MKNYLKNHYKVVLVAGFAMFSMFFGAGNLVFPLQLGALAGENITWAGFGLFITAVLVPFLGLISIIAYHGEKDTFFNTIGKNAAFWLVLVILCLMGPFGAVPRCIVVAYGGVELLWPSIPFWGFGLFFCLINLIIAWNYKKIIPVIGAFLTPLLIGFIAVLFAVAFYKTPPLSQTAMVVGKYQNFLNGLSMGYQTLDLLAAFFFCASTIIYLKSHIKKQQRPTSLIPLSLITSILGAILLAVVYLGFILLGKRYAPILSGVDPCQMVLTLAQYTMGSFAVPLVTATIFIACLTTVAVLIMLFAEFLDDRIFKKKLGRFQALLISTGLSYSMSLLGFSFLYKFLAEVLYILYPAILALTIANLLAKLFDFKYNKRVFWVVTFASLSYKLMASI